MKKTSSIAILVAIFFTASSHAADTAPRLPDLSEVFTVGVVRYAGNRFQPEFQFDEKSFLKAYPSFKPAKVSIPQGWDAVWQNGVIVTKDKRVLFWRTCDKRFIFVDTPDATYQYGVTAEVSLFDRIKKD